MYLSTVKVTIDFVIGWLRSSVLFLISNQLFCSKFCVSSVRLSVRPSITKFVRATTHHPFKLESPNIIYASFVEILYANINQSTKQQ